VIAVHAAADILADISGVYGRCGRFCSERPIWPPTGGNPTQNRVEELYFGRMDAAAQGGQFGGNVLDACRLRHAAQPAPPGHVHGNPGRQAHFEAFCERVPGAIPVGEQQNGRPAGRFGPSDLPVWMSKCSPPTPRRSRASTSRRPSTRMAEDAAAWRNSSRTCSKVSSVAAQFTTPPANQPRAERAQFQGPLQRKPSCAGHFPRL
jgi:hypothetical protein